MIIFSHFTTSTSGIFLKPSPPKSSNFNRAKMSTSMDQVDIGVTCTPRAPISPRIARSEEGVMLKKQDNLKDQRKKKSLNRQASRAQKLKYEAKNAVLGKQTHVLIGGGIGDGKSSTDDEVVSSIDEDEVAQLAEQVEAYEKSVSKLQEMKESLKHHVSFNMFCVIIILIGNIIMEGVRRSPESIKEMNAKMFTLESTFEEFCASALVNFTQVAGKIVISDLIKG